MLDKAYRMSYRFALFLSAIIKTVRKIVSR